jgi:2-aminobenzoylacetyl-CoA thioesterase
VTLNNKTDKAIQITSHFYQLGTSSFPCYLSLGEMGMIIEGGTGATSQSIVNQIKDLGIEPERIQYLTLTHSHADHIGAVPHLKLLWPHIKTVASSVAVKILSKPEVIQGFIAIDRGIAETMKAKGEIDALPPVLPDYSLTVDRVVEEGDTLDLGAGISWHVYAVPGHSPCHIALLEGKEKILDVGDATGFYVPEKDIFWPNYFESLEKYCTSIRKLTSLPAQWVALSHNCVIEGRTRQYFEKALRATEQYHQDAVNRLKTGEDPEQVANAQARWVNSFTDLQSFEAILGLCKLLLKRSQQDAEKPNLF